MTSSDHHALLAASRLGVLATLKASGLPQLSPVLPFYDPDAGTLSISMTEGRAKTANRTVTLTGPGTDPHGPEVEALVTYYRTAAGEHPDWDEFRATMVRDRRVLATMTVEHVYGDAV